MVNSQLEEHTTHFCVCLVTHHWVFSLTIIFFPIPEFLFAFSKKSHAHFWQSYCLLPFVIPSFFSPCKLSTHYFLFHTIFYIPEVVITKSEGLWFWICCTVLLKLYWTYKPPGILLKYRIWLSRSEVAPGFCISNRLPSDDDATDHWTTLKPCELNDLHSHMQGPWKQTNITHVDDMVLFWFGS